MITATDPKTVVVVSLHHAVNYLNNTDDWQMANLTSLPERDYNDRKASQLLEAKADLLLAEARIDSWTVDLGFNGCQVEG